MSKKGKYQKETPKKPLGWKKILLIVLAAVIVVVGVAAALGWNYFKGLIGNIRQAEYQENELSQEELEAILGGTVGTVPPEEETSEATEPTTEATTEPTIAATEPDYGELGKLINIMVVGQSYREGEDSKLSDTMILCTLNRETNTLTMTSFLRDSYVQLPNYKGRTCGKQRINVAYNLGYKWAGDLGGMEMLGMCIYNNFGVEVDYTIEVDFTALLAAVNKLGGVEIELDADEAKYLTESGHCKGEFVEGVNRLKGDAALAYARMRHATNVDNDFNRTARQRKLITQMIKQIMSLSLSEIDDLLKYILPMILTDMPEDVILEMVKIAVPMLPKLTIEGNQCPYGDTYKGIIVNIGGYDAGVMDVNTYANKIILTAIAEDGKSLEEAVALYEGMK